MREERTLPQWLPSTKGLPRTFWVLLTGMLINRIGGFVVPFLSLYLAGERHIEVQRVGEIVSLFGLGSLGSGPVGGTLADRLGRRPALALATFCGAASMLSLGFARSAEAIAVCALATGFFGELYRPVTMATVADVVPEADRPRAYGLIYWAVNLGFCLASIVAGLMASRSYTALFVGDAATTLAFGAIVVLSVSETRPAVTAGQRQQLRHFFAPYRHGAFVVFALVSFVFSMTFMQVHTMLPIDLTQHGVSPTTFGLLLAINGALIVLLQPVASAWTRDYARGRVLATGAALVAVGLGATDFARGAVPVYALSIVIWTLGEIAMAGLSPAVVADLAPRHLRGTYQGAFLMSFGAAALLSPVCGSAILEHFGSSALWRTCLAMGFLAAAGFIAVVPDGRTIAVVEGQEKSSSSSISTP